jgi:Uma2 family endonuclease
VICDTSKLDEKGCHGAPDWIIEVVSPSSKRMDYYTKLFKYRTAGVKEYWIVDHEKNCITVYDFQNDSGDDYTFSDTIPVGIYPDLEIDLSIINK